MAYELTDAEKKQILSNSIERVVNTAIKCAEYTEGSEEEATSERGSTSRQDLEELKWLIVKLWERERNLLQSHLLGVPSGQVAETVAEDAVKKLRSGIAHLDSRECVVLTVLLEGAGVVKPE